MNQVRVFTPYNTISQYVDLVEGLFDRVLSFAGG